MKKFFIMLIFINSFKAYSIENFECKNSDVILRFSINGKEPINVEVIKKQTKILSCQMEINSIENNPNAAAVFELYRISKKECQNIYDQEAKKYEFVKNGFLKRRPNDKTISAYLLKNKQPIMCSKLKK